MISPGSETAGSPASATGGSRPFLGWRAIAAAFTAQLLSSGVTFSAFGVFVVPLSGEFGIAEGRVGQALSVAILVMGALGPLVGRWLDRGLTRGLMVTGSAITGAGLLLLSRATDLWQMALLFCGVVAVGAALFGMGPSQALVANWYVRRRGLALGVAVAGATVASMAAPAIAAFLIDTVGWRGALAWFGAGCLAIGIPAFAGLVIARPELVGQAPDGDPPFEARRPEAIAKADATPQAAAAPPSEMIPTGELLRDPRLWLLAVGFGLVFTSPIVMVVTLVPFAEGLGFSRQNAAWFFTAAAPFSLMGKVAFGALADRLPAPAAIWLVVLGNALTWALLSSEPGYGMLLAIGAVYGLAIGAAGPLNGVVIGLCFGRLAFGRASGIGGLASLPLVAGAPTLAGLLRDATGSYQAAFATQIGLVLLGGLLLSLVRIPRSE